MAKRPPHPPVMALVKERRERTGMSQRGAAALAGISPTRWRQLEDGGRDMRGNWISEEAPDPTLARMALAVRLAPADIEPYSPRAALMLADLMAERNAEDQQDAIDAARMMDVLVGRRMSAQARAAVQAEIAESLRRIRDE